MKRLKIKQSVIEHFTNSGRVDEIILRFGTEIKGLTEEQCEEADFTQALDEELIEFYNWYEREYILT